MQTIGNVEAIKTFFSTPERPVTNSEILALRKACKPEEWAEIGEACAKALGVEYKPN